MFKVFAIGRYYFFNNQNMMMSEPFLDYLHAVVRCEKAALEFEVGEAMSKHFAWEC